MEYIIKINSDNSIKKIEKLFVALKELGAINAFDMEIVEEHKKEEPAPMLSENEQLCNLSETVETLYNFYPKKQGKAKGVEYLIAYLTKGREVKGYGKIKFNYYQLSLAIRSYAIECKDKEEQYIQMFSTFMCKNVIDYVDKTKAIYEHGMREKFGDDWQKVKFIYK